MEDLGKYPQKLYKIRKKLSVEADRQFYDIFCGLLLIS